MLSVALDGARSPFTSPIAVYEATLGLCRVKRASVEAAQARIHDFLRLAGIRIVALAPEACDGALDAFSRFGKGRGHPAQLNMGDCFAYAVAKAHGTPLLYKGEDFAATDIPSAAPGHRSGR